jgi:hypothetical protein
MRGTSFEAKDLLDSTRWGKVSLLYLKKAKEDMI